MARAAKAPRRKPGSGTIRHKKGRERPWEATWRHADGAAESRAFSERAEAARWLDDLVAKAKAGRITSGGTQTFDTFIQKWLAIKSIKVGLSTAHSYTYYCELASGEYLGKLRIDSITPETIEHMIAHFHRKGFKNLQQLVNPLKQAFDYAKRNKWIEENPMAELELPETDHRQIVILTEAQRAHMLRLAETEHDPAVPLLPLWHLYSRLGLRKGEGIALNWSDVDWERRTLTIDESVGIVGNATVRGKTKTRRTRTVPLPDDLLALLRNHQRAQIARGVFGAIFAGANGETVSPKHVQYRWTVLRQAAGVPSVTLHGLRHTALFLLEQAGVPESIRKALAGHTSAAMAFHYVDHASIEDVRRFVG